MIMLLLEHLQILSFVLQVLSFGRTFKNLKQLNLSCMKMEERENVLGSENWAEGAAHKWFRSPSPPVMGGWCSAIVTIIANMAIVMIMVAFPACGWLETRVSFPNPLHGSRGTWLGSALPSSQNGHCRAWGSWEMQWCLLYLMGCFIVRLWYQFLNV